MADPRLFRLRVTFRETGRLAMLSHLEVARALERAVRRAGLPFAVSQGFSPHMRIAFGAALPVGVGGTAEFFDLFLTDYVPAERALVALQEASPADLYPTEARYIEARDAAASVACPVSTYEVRLSAPPAAVAAPEQITVVRKKKEKTLTVSEFLVGPVSLEGDTVRFTLEAKPTGSLRADAFVRELIAATVAAGHAPDDLHPVSFMRVEQRPA
ncbi:TIGR03936 family radical SAM-associated protein [uncultured Adlercreutzia sp.]|uniref:TIGR03936 family radical SAM-associated protein n=1 Tax=uncultured Adlercreutzia sp. TaxID=875803 RepID=UPI0026F3E339|nr:TIGR03936 family radical SAM-associated protein [uncultured Adlercreutzia sp.]